MSTRNTIIIWDENATRVRELERNLSQAMCNTGIAANVQINSEPPLLMRFGLIGTTPAIQVNDGEFWRCAIGKEISISQFESLLIKLQKNGLIY